MTKTNDKPNIFRYATKELSQDAVIGWLIAWAGRKDIRDAEDEDLRECGRRFVEALLAEHGASLDGDIEEVEILQQDHSIDVLARINSRQVLLIEDKTDTSDHSGQLERYYKAVVGGKTGLGEVHEENLFPIFFKTGNQSKGADDLIEKKHGEAGKEYKVFNRKEFLEKVLDHYKGSNPILLDFRAYLQEWEDDTNSFKDWKEGESKKWSWKAWEGFFRHLEEKLVNCGWWGYVPNPRGGFRGLCWSINKIEGGEIKLQLEIVPGEPEMQKLCFKLGVGNKEDRGAMKDKWRKLVRDAGGEAVELPRTRSGWTMTIALWKNPWLAFDANGTLDLDKTVANLRKAEAVLAKAIDMEKRQGAETQS